MEAKKGRGGRTTAKMSSRDSKNSSLGSYEDDGVITWEGYMTQVEAADRVQSPGEVQQHALSPPFSAPSHPLCCCLRLGPAPS